MLYPAPPAIWLGTAAAAFSALLVVRLDLLGPVLLFDLAVLCLLAGDALFGTLRRRQLQLHEQRPRIWSLGRVEILTAQLRYDGAAACRARLTTQRTEHFLALEPIVQELELIPGRAVEVDFRLRPVVRGCYPLGGVLLCASSRLRLWHVQFRLGTPQPVAVYPDIRQLADSGLLARRGSLGLHGIRRLQRAGGDTEFERLREHQSDDPLSRIDWKATARREQLIVRTYQLSQSQQVVLLIDAGRMLAARQSTAGGASLLDASIDAALLVAGVALRQGDRVGLIAYADRVLRFLPPAGGQRQMQLLIHALHDLQPQAVESRHDLAFRYCATRIRKRSLLLCFTQVLDEVNAAMLNEHLRLLSGRHLPAAILLRNPAIADRLKKLPQSRDDFYTVRAAAQLATEQDRLQHELLAAGALAVNAEADDLGPIVVSKYLHVKARHLL